MVSSPVCILKHFIHFLWKHFLPFHRFRSVSFDHPPGEGKKMFSLKESYTGVDVNIGWSRRRDEKVNEKWFKFRCLFHSVCVFYPARYFLFVFFIINSFPFHPFFNIVLKCLDLFAISSTHNLLKLHERQFKTRSDTWLTYTTKKVMASEAWAFLS